MKSRRNFLKSVAALFGAIAAYPLLGNEKKGIAELLEDQARISARQHIMGLPKLRSLPPLDPRPVKPDIGDLMVIKAGTPFWSINIQENVRSERDIVIRVTNIGAIGDTVFGSGQLIMENIALASVRPERNDHRSFLDNAHRITIGHHLLVPYVVPPNMFAKERNV